MVDDGSEDGTVELCENYQRIDGRIRFFRKSNGGVSSARNFGILKARGKWITFVDSDDSIIADVYGYVLSELREEYGLFMVGYRKLPGGSRGYKRDGRTLLGGCFKAEDVELIREGLLDQEGKYFKRLGGGKIDFYSPWAKFYRQTIILGKQVFFPEHIKMGEDRIFNYQYLKYVSKIYYTAQEGYCYYQNVYSFMNAYSEGKGINCLQSAGAFWQVIEDKHKRAWAQYSIRQYLFALKLDYCHPDNPKKFYCRRREALAMRNEKIIDEGFRRGNIFNLRPAALPIGLLAKGRMFGICNLLLYIKAILKIRL